MLPPTREQGSPALPASARWFEEEIHPHESSLRGYLKHSFPTLRDIDDVVQESFLRLCRRHASRPIEFAKAFLFTVARRLALDLLRRERRSPFASVGIPYGLDVLDGNPGVAERLSQDEKLEILIEAIDALPGRCREVVILRKLKLVPQKEVATRLGISEKGVEIQLTRGLARCRRMLRDRGITHFYGDEL